MSIQPNQLRIGNYIVFNDDDSIAKVIGIHTNPHGVDVQFEEEETYIELDKFSGIYITSERLLKCGFRKHGHLISIQINKTSSLTYNEDSKKVFLSINYLNTSVTENINFIHEIQNIYHSLTFKDLQVSLQKLC